MWLFLAFLLVPLIEIALFIQVGGLIGLWPTLAIVVITAIVGTALVRSQGLRALGDLQGSFSRLEDPTTPLAHGAMILLAGALLRGAHDRRDGDQQRGTAGHERGTGSFQRGIAEHQ